MKDMGLMHYFLGLKVWKGQGDLFFSQGKYANEILNKLFIGSSKPIDTPLEGGWRKEDSTLGEEVGAPCRLTQVFGEPSSIHVLCNYPY